MIDVSWITIEKHDVVLFTFHPSWTWDDFHVAQQKVTNMLELTTNKIPIFFDFRYASNLPPGMIREMRSIVGGWHPDGTPLLVIGANQIIYNAFSVAARMLHESQLLDNIHFVESPEAAEALLQWHFASR